MRRAHRIDDNHRAVRAALEAAGGYVVDLSSLGRGVPDFLVGRAGRWVLMECKDGAKSPSRRRLTEAEASVVESIRRRGLPVYVVESPEGAVRALGEFLAAVAVGAV